MLQMLYLSIKKIQLMAYHRFTMRYTPVSQPETARNQFASQNFFVVLAETLRLFINEESKKFAVSAEFSLR